MMDFAFLKADLRNRDRVREFLKDKKVSLLYSDPPWDVGKVTYYRNIAGAERDFGLEQLWRNIAWLYNEFAQGPFYLEMGVKNAEWFARVLEAEGLRVHAVYDAYYNNATILYKILYGHKDGSYPFQEGSVPPGLRTYRIMQWGVERDTQPGENVLDCCIGLGNLLRACLVSRRGCYGIELSLERLSYTIKIYDAWKAKQKENVL